MIHCISARANSCFQAVSSNAQSLISAINSAFSSLKAFPRAIGSLLGRVCTATGLTAITNKITNIASRFFRSEQVPPLAASEAADEVAPGLVIPVVDRRAFLDAAARDVAAARDAAVALEVGTEGAAKKNIEVARNAAAAVEAALAKWLSDGSTADKLREALCREIVRAVGAGVPNAAETEKALFGEKVSVAVHVDPRALAAEMRKEGNTLIEVFIRFVVEAKKVALGPAAEAARRAVAAVANFARAAAWEVESECAAVEALAAARDATALVKARAVKENCNASAIEGKVRVKELLNRFAELVRTAQH